MEHVSIGLAAKAVGFLKKSWRYLKMWALLPIKVEKLLSIVASKPMSPDAKFCGSCDNRMKIDKATAQQWRWFCQSCNQHITYKAP